MKRYEPMNFWNDRMLARRFKAGDVSQKERFRYFFAILLLLNVDAIIAHYVPDAAHPWDMYESWSQFISLAIFIVGIFLCFRTNRRGDDKEFVERYISLCFPVGVKITVITIAIHALIGPIAGNITRIEQISDVVLNIYFYYRINTSLRIASAL